MDAWFIVVDGTRIGPKTTSEIDAGLADGSIKPDTLAWTEGQTEWRPLASLGVFRLPARAVASTAPADQPAAKVGGSARRVSARIIDLVGTVATPVGLALAALCALALLGYLVAWLLAFRTPMKAPTYAEVEALVKEESAGGTQSFSDLDLHRKLEQKYGEDLSAVLKSRGLPAEFYDALLADAGSFDEKYRDLFLRGFMRLADAKGKAIEPEIVNGYRRAFRARIVKTEEGAVELTLKRSALAAGAAISMFALFGFLVVPLLIQVERNTRAR